ncbi:MAG TPA: hypothetical protein VFB82_12285 [Blastocatellia bacterium]|jgi:hypothetical protein|nr:hypothetical protein [Blastocatellia bacterium]
MQIRLIKPGAPRAHETKERPQKDERPPEVQIVDTVRSWVNDFRSRKASKARMDIRLISRPTKA